MRKVHVFAALACCLALIGCGKKADEADSGEGQAVTPVQVAAAQRGAIPDIVRAEAILHPIQQANIIPKISAPVEKFYAQRGDHVRAGQLLAVLDNRDLTAAANESKDLYDQAAANYETVKAATVPEDLAKSKADADAAKQAFEAAQKVYQSRVKLYEEGALAQRMVQDARVAMVQAQATFDTAQKHLQALEAVGSAAQLKGAQAQMQAAHAHYEGAEAQVYYSEVRSPISGVVADRPLYVGEMAGGGTALFSIVDISHLVARASVPVHDAASMRVGQPAIITGPGAELQGKVTVVSPAVDPSTTTIEVWVDAPNPGEKLKPGVTAQIAITVGTIKDAVIVPEAALLSSEEGGEKVMIAGSDGLAHESPVKIGVREGGEVQILSGVKPGDQVIVEGGLGLDDKSKIKIVQPGATEDKDKDEK
ncbi:MAG TPA: efflux RND transporter periplasmic adaptor subunit [Bryobacteraceae bacterium]|jgi:multidrug efflux pump subunit AcrA (membrane-fusion protein)|nr:efflux RND transporter periplasmic adaptor subunit [Bryobacteraceae bacterium]